MKLYNTLTGTTETFAPNSDVVTMYVCGITPYSPSHLGHALKAAIFDVLRRYLEYSGLQVKHVENFTDIDDKMIDRAAEEGITTGALAEKNILRYIDEINKLNVLPAHFYPRATNEIPKMLEIIENLIEREMAYVIKGDVYFRVRRFKDYGKLSRRSLEDMRAGNRIENTEQKEDVMDFALWKSQKPHEPAWDSPWGPGRPGWHIECSAMSMRYLGDVIDIHGGGQELMFPHHENEIAQTESYTLKEPMAKFWVHNGLMRLGDEKMSKSLGNLVTVKEALEKYSIDALRLFFVSSHYRSPLMFTDESLDSQERAVERLRQALSKQSVENKTTFLDATPNREEFVRSMDDDLNTPKAIASLFDLAKEINRSDLNVTLAQETLMELSGVLGLNLGVNQDSINGDVAPLIELLIDARSQLRSAKMYEEADQIRDSLEQLGYVLEDGSGSTSWKLQIKQSSK